MDFLQIKVALEIAQTRITLPLFTLDICSFAFMSFSLSLSLSLSFPPSLKSTYYLTTSFSLSNTCKLILSHSVFLSLTHSFSFSLFHSLSHPLSLSHSPLSQMQVLSHSFSTSLTCINNIISFGLPLSHTFCFLLSPSLFFRLRHVL